MVAARNKEKTMSNQTNPIATLNDAMRRSGPRPSAAGDQWLITDGISERGDNFAARAIREVMSFDSFTADNDPYGEHDFGSIEVDGVRMFWKIDYYDRALEFGSPDPADSAVTCRVLTVMLASEY
jgi:hypothetical protein